ncbi:hypothetical protein CI238_07398 [Colletotrichum incanum]|uniref:Uncharacterized protein n=1 Tax=Colletotrichum incanum TaxID=1573173 RepID=A0A166LA23_COLIC|nr:hypothetical protein CI238_07398 [Colletotrichum incanum]
MPSVARLILLTATLAAMVQAAPVESSSEPGDSVTILSAEEIKPHTGPVVPVSAPDGILEVVSEVSL